MNLSATTFSLANARESAAWAQAAYGNGNEILSPMCSFQLIQGTATDTQLMVIELFDHIVIAFRGTSDLRDAFTDIQIKRFPISGGSAHVGFVRAILEVMPRLEAYLATLSTAKPLVITGHSLGGALAALFAYLWELKFRQIGSIQLFVHRIAFVYTFGKPRVFNVRLAAPA